jgi:hypothetical protein
LGKYLTPVKQASRLTMQAGQAGSTSLRPSRGGTSPRQASRRPAEWRDFRLRSNYVATRWHGRQDLPVFVPRKGGTSPRQAGYYLFTVSFRLPAIASRHVRHRLRLRQCRAGSGEAGGEENDKTQTPSAKSSNLQKNIVKVWYLGPTAGKADSIFSVSSGNRK